MTRKRVLKSMLALTLVVLLCCTFVMPSFAKGLNHTLRTRMINWGTFQQGSNAGPVRVIQRYMLCHNSVTAYYVYVGGGVDGDFGYNTRMAVLNFQSSVGIGNDGIVGRDSWTAMSQQLTDNTGSKIVHKVDYYVGSPYTGINNVNGNIWKYATYSITPYNTNGSSITASFDG